MIFTVILCSAILLDQIFGDPRIFAYLKIHPVILTGYLINFLRRIFFKNIFSFRDGFFLCVTTLSITGFFAFLILYVSKCSIYVQILMLYFALAWRDLKDETEKVFLCLIEDNIEGARKFLSRVVGRDTENLEKHEIISALIETISENSIDGIISVIFFAALGYLINNSYGMIIAVWLFKAASTLDSMVGYESFGKFGTASARLDDILNFIPARIGGFVIIFAGILLCGNAKNALKIFLHDRKNHKSPNSAHGESAFAGVLNIKLGGGAFYNGKFSPRPFINEKANTPELYDILRAWKLLDVSCFLFMFFMIFLVILLT